LNGKKFIWNYRKKNMIACFENKLLNPYWKDAQNAE